MRKVREILRLRLSVGLSARRIAKSCGVATSTVLAYEKRAIEAGLTWPLPDEMDDDRLGRIVRARSGDFTHNRPVSGLAHLRTLHLISL